MCACVWGWMVAGCIPKTDGVVLCSDTHLHTLSKLSIGGQRGWRSEVCMCVCVCTAEASDQTLCSRSPSTAWTNPSSLSRVTQWIPARSYKSFFARSHKHKHIHTGTNKADKIKQCRATKSTQPWGLQINQETLNRTQVSFKISASFPAGILHFICLSEAKLFLRCCAPTKSQSVKTCPYATNLFSRKCNLPKHL